MNMLGEWSSASPCEDSLITDDTYFEASSYGIAIIESVSGKISRANDAYCALLGRTRERIVGQPWMRFTHLEDVARNVYVIHQMYKTNAPRASSLKRYINVAGDIVNVEVEFAPFGEGSSGRSHIVIARKI